MCPIIKRVKGYPFEVLIPEGFGVRGVVLSDQLKSLDWRKRKADFICKVPNSVTEDVLSKLETLLR